MDKKPVLTNVIDFWDKTRLFVYQGVAQNVPTAFQGQFENFWPKNWRHNRKKEKSVFISFFFEYMPAHANVIFEGMYLASCVIIMRTSDLTQFNLKRNNPPLTRVLRTQYSADLN